MEEISKEKFEDQIAQLLENLESHIKCCDTLLLYFQKHKDKKDASKFFKFYTNSTGYYLISTCNMHFLEGISILYTLLCSKNSEISFASIISRLKQEAQLEFYLLKDEFDTKGFIKLRNNLVDHKHKKIVVNPLLIYNYPVSQEKFQSLKNIFEKLNKWAYANFVLTGFGNAYAMERGLKDILNQIKIIDIDREIIE